MKNQENVVKPETPYLKLKSLGKKEYLLDSRNVGQNLRPIILKKHLFRNIFYLLFVNKKTGTRVLFSGSLRKLTIADTWSVRLTEQVFENVEDSALDDFSGILRDSERIFSFKMGIGGNINFEPLEEVILKVS